MFFVINDENLRKAWGGSAEFWFSGVDYCIHEGSELKYDDEIALIETGFIPYVTVTDEQVMRAFIKTLGNKKLESRFEDIDSDEFVETFWKYYNAYPQISTGGYDKFETEYVLNKVIDWCDSHSIKYKIEK